MTQPVSAAPLDFIVRQQDLHTCAFRPAPAPDDVMLQAGEVLLKVDKFAFTSNNVTYAAFGEAMSYWNFFPAPDGWGRIPVWGFGDVLRSNCEGIRTGERFYGYFPMSSHVTVQPERVNDAGFFDGVAHRKALHPVYNQYLRTATDPSYQQDREAEMMLLRPLLITSFLIDDFLDDNGFFGAQTVILSSASSKTAYGLAYLLSRRGKQYEVIGLTSPANRAFVEGLGCYHRVVSYDDVTTLPTGRPAVYVDMAGNGKLRSTLHHHFGDMLMYSCAVGGTHWDQGKTDRQLPGPRPALFFAPAQIKKRAADWGPNGVQERFALVWRDFLRDAGHWMQVTHDRGPEAMQAIYLDMIEGRSRPNQGHVLSL
jgi:Protein of unknown function (DUF2855)